jgi:hypothetical protein
LAGRSRKRGRRQQPAATPAASAATPTVPAATVAPSVPAVPAAPSASAAPAATRPPAAPAQATSPGAGYGARSEARNAAVRATLTPLAPGERPWPIKIAALTALLIGAGDLIVVIVDGSFRVGGAHTAPGGVVLFSVLMLVCAWGMWQLRYWAVLGFQAILLFVILIFSLLLLRANNLLAVLTGVLVVGGGGYLFYKLVRVLSRIQMPEHP